MNQEESTPTSAISALIVGLVRQLTYAAGGLVEVCAPEGADAVAFEALLRGLDNRGLIVTHEEARGVYQIKSPERPPEINKNTGRCYTRDDRNADSPLAAPCGCMPSAVWHDLRSGGMGCRHGEWKTQAIYDYRERRQRVTLEVFDE